MEIILIAGTKKEKYKDKLDAIGKIRIRQTYESITEFIDMFSIEKVKNIRTIFILDSAFDTTSDYLMQLEKLHDLQYEINQNNLNNIIVKFFTQHKKIYQRLLDIADTELPNVKIFLDEFHYKSTTMKDIILYQ